MCTHRIACRTLSYFQRNIWALNPVPTSRHLTEFPIFPCFLEEACNSNSFFWTLIFQRSLKGIETDSVQCSWLKNCRRTRSESRRRQRTRLARQSQATREGTQTRFDGDAQRIVAARRMDVSQSISAREFILRKDNRRNVSTSSTRSSFCVIERVNMYSCEHGARGTWWRLCVRVRASVFDNSRTFRMSRNSIRQWQSATKKLRSSMSVRGMCER